MSQSHKSSLRFLWLGLGLLAFDIFIVVIVRPMASILFSIEPCSLSNFLSLNCSSFVNGQAIGSYIVLGFGIIVALIGIGTSVFTGSR